MLQLLACCSLLRFAGARLACVAPIAAHPPWDDPDQAQQLVDASYAAVLAEWMATIQLAEEPVNDGGDLS